MRKILFFFLFLFFSLALFSQSNIVPITTEINGLQVVYHFPLSCKGVIYLYHGSGGSAMNWFTKTEGAIFIQMASQSGYATVASESHDRVDKKWNPLPPHGDSNLDLLQMKAVKKYLIDRGLISSNVREFGVGMSNGGGFVSLAGHILGYRAVGIYCASGYDLLYKQPEYKMPVIFNYAENDTIVSPSKIEKAIQYLKSKKILLQENLKKSEPLLPHRFSRIQGISIKQSREIFQAFQNNGYLDTHGYLIQNPRDSGWQAIVPDAYKNHQNSIQEQLLVVYAEHQFMSDFTQKTLSFFHSF